MRERHGHTWRGPGGATKTYKCWSSIKARCRYEQHPDWENYGGRGITVCDRWFDSFEAFLSDMGEAPAGMSIERRDNDRGYEPGNCIWTTKAVQARNRRSGKLNAKDVQTIRAARGVTQASLAIRFSVDQSMISLIRNRRVWR